MDMGYKPEITLSFPTSDRKAAIAWYKANLGFELMYDAPDLGWCEITSNMPGVSLGFGENQAIAKGGCVPVFAVQDMASFRARLEANGVVFDGPTQDLGFVKLATFYDNDGHALMLSEQNGPMG